MQLVCIAASPELSLAAPVTGAALSTAYACYKLRCSSTPPPANHAVTDGLGSAVPTTNYRVELLCLPANVGPISSSTTTTTTLPPCDTVTPSESPQCTGGSCKPGLECGNIGAGRCGCVPSPPPLCGDALAPLCGGKRCPPGQTCGQAGLGLACACIDDGLVPCGDATAPQCDGFCPAGTCITSGSSCFCWVDFGPCGASAYNGTAPECNGECPSPDAPYCRDVGGTCVCAP